MSRRGLVFGSVVVALGVGCSLLNPLDGYSGGQVDATVPSSTVTPPSFDSAVPEASPGDAGCVSARPPARPPATGSQDGGSTTIVAALATFELADQADPKIANRRGYDLDLVCTCPGPRACAPKGSAAVCDFPNGVDNSGGAWLLGLASLQPGTLIGEGISDGRSGLLVRVRNYNDLPDDEDVEVALFDTLGTEGTQPDAGSPSPLKRDGTDRWTVDSRSLLGGVPYLPVAVDTRAYVRGGVVVAEIRFPFRVGNFQFTISAGYLTASLVKRSGGYGLANGILAGRLNVSQFLTAFETISSPAPAPGPGFLCGSDPFYLGVRDSLCRVLDLPTDPNTDGRDAPCDAVSLLVGFAADPAVLGNVVQAPSSPRPCGNDWVGKCP